MLVDMKFLASKNVLPQPDLLEKSAIKKATIKRFVYSSLSKELKTQTDIAKKQNIKDLTKFMNLIKSNRNQTFKSI